MDVATKGARAWEKVTAQVRQMLGLLAGRMLSCTGQVKAVSVVLLPVIRYTGIVFPLSWRQVTKILREICVFSWRSKRRRLAQMELFRKREAGRWGVPDVCQLCEYHVQGV